MGERKEWFLNPETWPDEMPVLEPWGYKVAQLNLMLQFWRSRQTAGNTVLEFRNCKADDDRRGYLHDRGKGKGKAKETGYTEIDEEEEEQWDGDDEGMNDNENKEEARPEILKVKQDDENEDEALPEILKVKQEVGEEQELLHSKTKGKQPQDRFAVQMEKALQWHSRYYKEWNARGCVNCILLKQESHARNCQRC